MIPPWIIGTSVAAAALSVIVLASCRSNGTSTEVLPQDVLAFDELGGGVTSGVTDSGLHVLRDQEAFDALWRQHTRLQLPTPPTPEVDFDVSMVVATFAGQKTSGGYSVRIEEVIRMPETADSTSQIVVRTLETVPGADAVTTMMTTSPFHMVRVPKADGDSVHVPE